MANNGKAIKKEKTDSETDQHLDELLSGKISQATGRKKKSKKRERAVELLPARLRKLADVLAAGKAIKKEIDTKTSLSEQHVKEYCVKRFCERFAATGHRPPSTIYAGNKSRFTFIQTKRTYLSQEKADALQMLNIPIDDYTELSGLEVDYAAIKEHKLELKLRDALERMDVPAKVLDDCFRPKIELKEGFFESLNSVVEKSLQKDEKLPEKMYDVVSILAPANQIKNPEIQGLSPVDSFKIVEESDIPMPDESESA